LNKAKQAEEFRACFAIFKINAPAYPALPSAFEFHEQQFTVILCKSKVWYMLNDIMNAQEAKVPEVYSLSL